MMRKPLWMLLVAGLGCRNAEEGTTAPSVEQLAAAWSAGGTPTCQVPATGSGSRAEKCEWPWVVTAVDSGRLNGELQSRDRFLYINWGRRFVDSASALQLRDSLSKALLGHGLQERECRYRGRRWESPDLGVEFILDTAAERWVASIFATPHPEAIPSLFCPAQPPMPRQSRG